MAEREVSPVPGSYVGNIVDLERVADMAATRAAAAVRDQCLTGDDAERIAEEAINRFLLRVGIEHDDLPNLRKDFTALRSMRETREAVFKHGVLVVVGMLLMGIGTACWLAIKGAK